MSPDSPPQSDRARSAQADDVGCTRTLLATLAAAAWVVAPSLHLDGLLGPGPLSMTAGAVPSLALGASAWWHRSDRTASRMVATLVVLAWSSLWVVAHPRQPGLGFIVLSTSVVSLASLWPPDRPGRRHDLPRSSWTERDSALAAAVAVICGIASWRGAPSPGPDVLLALSIMFLAPVARRLTALGNASHALRVAYGLTSCAAIVPALAIAVPALAPMAPVGIAAPLVFLFDTLGRAAAGDGASGFIQRDPTFLDAVLGHPPRVLVVSFALLCLFGTVALSLPAAASGPAGIGWLDAAFTAVSATCVTGLAVVDTAGAFSPLGELTVLVLIQIGGLGIMVFSAAAFVLLGRRLSLSHEAAAVDLVGATDRAGLVHATRQVLYVTLITEGVGAVLLFGAFLHNGESAGSAAWRALFTAISAFCNAGFALQADSLVGYANQPFVLAVVGLVITVGGLGPVVVAAMATPRRARWSLHVRLVLWSSAILVVAPAIMLTALEWNGTLAGMSTVDRISNGFFQSITLRTAGFNSIDLAQIQPASWTLMVLVMFIGGSPGSTAGGAKTTTIAVVILAIASIARGRDHVEAFGRTLLPSTILRATAVTAAGVLSCVAALFAVQITQALPLDVALFEVVSALATVGLSTGGTGALDEVGRLIIMACMFAGRVGPLTLFFFLSPSRLRPSAPRLPDETVPIG